MKSKSLLALLAAGVVLCGCSKDAQDGNGRFRINFSTDTEVVEKTRALDGLIAPAHGEFSLQVVKDDNSFDQSWTSITDYPGEGYYIQVGGYTATALCGDIDQEGFGHPCFGATKSFSVVSQTTTQVEMVAKLLNMAVTIEYTDAFKGYFPERNSIIMRGSEEIVDFSADPTGIAFIKPEAFKVKVDYTKQNDRTGSVEFNVAEKVGACTHQKITLDVNNGQVGDVAIVVTFNDEVETITLPIEAGDED